MTVLTRFHQVLVDEIRSRRPEYLSGPFTVAEIYQSLVPYSTHRDRLGVEMNGDYEDALLRLLAGEGGYLVLDSDAALHNLRDELDSANPNTGLYREYAAVDVRLNPQFLDGARADGDGVVARGEPAISMEDLAPRKASPTPDFFDDDASPATSSPVAVLEASTETPTPPPAPPPPTASAAHPSPGGPAAPHACRWCRADLPRRENLNFCPFCGTDVHLIPCPKCGEELEADWRFCPSCGTEALG